MSNTARKFRKTPNYMKCAYFKLIRRGYAIQNLSCTFLTGPEGHWVDCKLAVGKAAKCVNFTEGDGKED